MSFSGWIDLAGWYTTEIGRQPWLFWGDPVDEGCGERRARGHGPESTLIVSGDLGLLIFAPSV
jgi:hypothetical protein